MKLTYIVAILALFLLASPIYAADTASVQQIKTEPIMEIKPVTMAVLDKFVPIYYADGHESTGSVYYAASSTSPDSIFYTRPSENLYSFTFHPGIPEKLYYANSNQRSIYMTAETGSAWSAETTAFTHTTYVDDIAFAFDQNGNLGLYFSEASATGGDGKIYRVDASSSAVPFYTVKLSDVDGYWGGDFAFDYDGNLYLSSGNHVPASIYKVDIGTGAVTKIFESRTGSIAGLVYRDGYIYYADWGQNIYRLDLSSMTSTVYYTNPSRTWLSDVGFREKRDGGGSRPMVGVAQIITPPSSGPVRTDNKDVEFYEIEKDIRLPENVVRAPGEFENIPSVPPELRFIPPAAPTNLVKLEEMPCRIKWSDNSNNEDGFNIYITGRGGADCTAINDSDWRKVASVGPDVDSYTWSTSCSYVSECSCVMVRAYNISWGESAKSNAIVLGTVL
jgi:hypothetical protein